MSSNHPQQHVGDNPDEVFDLIDADDRVIGQVRRGDAHHNPALLHRSVQVLIVNTRGRFLLQRRSRTKDLFPGYYSAAASGHVDAGEDYLTAAKREMREELGVDLPLTYLSKTLVRSPMETEMTALFLAKSDGPFQFHPVETQGGDFFTWDELCAGRASGALPMTPALLATMAELERLTTDGAIGTLLATL